MKHIQNVINMVATINELIAANVTEGMYFYVTLDILMGYYQIKYLNVVIYDSQEETFDEGDIVDMHEMKKHCLGEMLQIAEAISQMKPILKDFSKSQ